MMRWIRRSGLKDMRAEGSSGLNSRQRGAYLDIRSIVISHPGVQDNNHSHFRVIIEGVDKHGRQRLKYRSNTMKAKSLMEIQWIVDENLCLMESRILITVVRCQQVVTDQMLVKVPISLVDVVTHLHQRPDTAFTVLGPHHKLAIEINQGSLQEILNSVQPPDAALQKLHSAKQTMTMLLSADYGLNAFHPTIKAFIEQVSDMHSKIQGQAIIFSQVEELIDKIGNISSLLSQIQTSSKTTKDVDSALKSLTMGVGVIFSYHCIDAKDLLQAIDKVKHCEELSQIFSDMQQQVKVLSKVIETEHSKKDDSKILQAKLQYLQPVSFVQGTPCLPGTRKEILHMVYTWKERHSPQLFWLTGIAGTGKSTVAESVFRMLSSEEILGAYFTCKRDHAELHNALNVLPTICYHLGIANPQYGQLIANEFHENPSFGMGLGHMQTQFEVLFTQCIKQLSAHEVPKSQCIIIDALDEC
ncbi:hypothetical protein BDN72DRAFT_799737, partial [Pluteus cervinus]